MMEVRLESLTALLTPADRNAVPVIGGKLRSESQSTDQVDEAFRVARIGTTLLDDRIRIIERVVLLLRAHRLRLMALLASESGRGVKDALAEIVATKAFARQLVETARLYLSGPQKLAGPTGESNVLHTAARGPIACISGGNAPLLGFVGQALAAYVAGNPVIAKPSSRAHLVAFLATRIVHEAGIPPSAFALVLGPNTSIGKRLLEHPSCCGVAYTGSEAAGAAVNRIVAAREGSIIPVVTGLSPRAPYLLRFVTERTVTVNTAAAGGNTSLMTASEDE